MRSKLWQVIHIIKSNEHGKYSVRAIVSFLAVIIIIGTVILAPLEYFGVTNIFPDQRTSAQHSPSFFMIEDQNFISWAHSIKKSEPQEKYQGHFKSSFFNGGITLEDVLHDKNTVYGNFNTGYQEYELSGKFEINLLNDSKPVIIFDIFSGNIQTIYGSANRISGKIAINMPEDKPVSITSTLNAGAFSYGGVSFQGTQVLLNGPIDHTTAEIKGEMAGHNGSILEAKGTFENAVLHKIKGYFSVQSPYNLIYTLNTMASGESSSNLDEWKNMAPIAFLFQETPKSTPQIRRFSIRLENRNNTLRGLVSLNPELNILRIVAETKQIYGYPLLYNRELDNGQKISKVYADLILNGRKDDDQFGYAD